MFDLGAPELLIIAVIILLLFGSAKLPSLARSVGQARREFQRGQEDSDDAHVCLVRQLGPSDLP